MQSIGEDFCGDVVLDSFNKASWNDLFRQYKLNQIGSDNFYDFNFV